MASGFSDHLRKYLFLRAVGDGDGGEEPFGLRMRFFASLRMTIIRMTIIRKTICGDGRVGFFEYALDGIRIGDLLGP